MKRTVVAALALFAACAPATTSEAPSIGPATTTAAAPAALNPVGMFPFTTAVNGNEVTGSIEVTGQAGEYGGTIRTSVTPDIPITGVVVTGQQMVVAADTPDGPLTLTLAFTGDTFTGEWELNGDSGAIRGRRGP
jgi:hypothetical protein